MVLKKIRSSKCEQQVIYNKQYLTKHSCIAEIATTCVVTVQLHTPLTLISHKVKLTVLTRIKISSNSLELNNIYVYTSITLHDQNL